MKEFKYVIDLRNKMFHRQKVRSSLRQSTQFRSHPFGFESWVWNINVVLIFVIVVRISSA